MIIGPAQAYTSAWNAESGALLVVREFAERTDVSLITIDADRQFHLEELTGTISRRLSGGAGNILSDIDVDLSAFSSSGRISIKRRTGQATQIKGGQSSMAVDLRTYLPSAVNGTPQSARQQP